MYIEIFELKGLGELSTDLDALIINLYNKYKDDIRIRKIDIMNKEMMKGHKDIVKIIKTKNEDVLPLVKVNGKIVDQSKLEHLLRKRF